MTLTLALFLAMNIPPAADGTPNKQPQLAAANGVVALTFGSGNAVMFTASKDNGETFSKPVMVAEVPGLSLGRHRGPRVAISGKTILVSAIPGTGDGNLLLWRSGDGGRNWSKPATINDAPTSAREGLHAMSADDSGHAAMVWLDDRAKRKQLYGAFSSDAGATWSKNVLLYESPDGTICQCCHPSLAAIGKGEFAVMFRNFLGGNRDMYLLRVREGQVVAKAERLGLESWTLNACPMDGGGVAIDNGRVVTAWRRGMEIFLAEPGQKEKKLGGGMDVALAANHGETFVLWTQRGAVVRVSGGTTEVLGEGGAFPVITSLPGGGALAAWEENGVIRTRRLS
jgi:hypothetical protein